MWRAIFPLLLFGCCIIDLIDINRGTVSAKYFTEGGSYQMPQQQQNSIKYFQQQPSEDPDQQYYDVGMLPQQQQQQNIYTPNSRYVALDSALRNKNDEELAEIVNELEQKQYEKQQQLLRQQQQEEMLRQSEAALSELYEDNGVANSNEEMNSADPYELMGLKSSSSSINNRPHSRDQRANQALSESELDELQRFGKEIKELTDVTDSQNNQNEEILKPSNANKNYEQRPQWAIQKKGQSEFVEFIDPLNAKIIRNKEFMEKRVANGHKNPYTSYHALNLFSGSGNIAFMAFITMCCVMSVVGVVGGMYYYNHVRTAREDPFDDFTRYSPAGPGRDKLKRGGGGNNTGTFVGELGDDTLAYKAQLHHYQQNKQKIIGSDDSRIGNGAIHTDDVDDISDNDEADLEHNFSVYECPGLAPTGDIEVQNPNFVEKTH